MGKKITLSVIKADVGGYVGHSNVHPELLEKAREMLSGHPLLIDSYVAHVGDDINLIMTHETGRNNGEIHKLAWDTFLACTEYLQCPNRSLDL
jgi:fructose 1,6-bisphosphate aldolase/phosphatase